MNEKNFYPIHKENLGNIHPPVLDKMRHRPMPPKHTQIQPRCLTCSHFEMCSYKKDYLKTITLIQNILGCPSENYEITTSYIEIPGFHGLPFIGWEIYLPKEISFDNCNDNGKIFAAKFNGVNHVFVVYKVKQYYILITLKYNKETEIYDIVSCEEAFYKVEYELDEQSKEALTEQLVDWKSYIEDFRILPPQKKDVINTTHFSAALECDMYDWNKIPYDDAVKNFAKKYPHGICVDEHGHEYYHIATYHTENHEIPFSPLLFEDKAKRCKKPPKRREDM